MTRRIDGRLESPTSAGGIDFDIGEAIERGQSLFEKAGPTLKAALEIIEDPYLPEVVCHVSRLARIERGERPGSACIEATVSPAVANRGIGLRLAIKPLRAVVWARLHPLLASAIGISFVGALVGIGIAIGKGRSE